MTLGRRGPGDEICGCGRLQKAYYKNLVAAWSC
jgi:hypothetical protein